MSLFMSRLYTFIYDMMRSTNQNELIAQYQLEPFKVQVLDVVRTVCEKILSLVRFSYSENPIADLKLKIRHLYDLHRILGIDEIKEFISSPDFELMLNRVGQDDVAGYRNNNAWLNYHPKNALIFNDTEQVWKELESTYLKDFRGLVYGEFPSPSAIFVTLKFLRNEISQLTWVVRVD